MDEPKLVKILTADLGRTAIGAAARETEVTPAAPANWLFPAFASTTDLSSVTGL